MFGQESISTKPKVDQKDQQPQQSVESAFKEEKMRKFDFRVQELEEDIIVRKQLLSHFEENDEELDRPAKFERMRDVLKAQFLLDDAQEAKENAENLAEIE